MAAIDPTEEPMYDEDDTERKAPRATLKIVRIPGDMFGDDEDDSEDDDEMDLLNGLGEDSDEDDMEDISEDDAKAITALKKIMKGKGKAMANDSDKDSDDLDDDEDPLELEEVVICTLDPEKVSSLVAELLIGD
jgi:FK506-binding nuclear protein